MSFPRDGKDCIARTPVCTKRFDRSSDWLGWSDPSGLLATRQWQKVGSLQPILVFCPCPNPIPRQHATSMLPTTSHHPPGDAKGEAEGDDPVSCTLHPSTLQNVIETLWHPHASTIKEALETEKVRNKVWPELLRPRILIVFSASEAFRLPRTPIL